MATYKVIQDIEAEDKFVGPLTLKQFVFAMIGVFFGWVGFFTVTKGAAWALIFILPLMLFGFFMAFPWSKDQPTDVWVLAKLRFRFGSKKRIWDQAGVQELVTITAPKKIERILTNDLSEFEVKSRLKALAETIDSRGWAVKNASVAEAFVGYQPISDRLVDPAILPKQVAELSDADVPDMMEDTSMDQMIVERDNLRKSQVAEKMDRVRHGADPASIDQSEVIVSSGNEQGLSEQQIAANIDEKLLTEQIKAKRTAGDIAYKRMSSIPGPGRKTKSTAQRDDQADDNSDQKTEVGKNISAVTEHTSPDILELAQNNDLNVATIARQAKSDKLDDNEVVISLH
ncbi:PrgI family protein [Candidatus Saccharibacteria bacterium]|nr:PrgI family protein [Candidatus Saccharibacteria bacterium]